MHGWPDFGDKNYLGVANCYEFWRGTDLKRTHGKKGHAQRIVFVLRFGKLWWLNQLLFGESLP